jgi:hypothetical protein
MKFVATGVKKVVKKVLDYARNLVRIHIDTKKVFWPGWRVPGALVTSLFLTFAAATSASSPGVRPNADRHLPICGCESVSFD